MLTARRGGWTLVELLVVTGVVAVSGGLVLTAVPKVREAAARMQCSNNLKQIVLSAHNIHSSYNFIPSNPDTVSDHFGTVQYLLLPYME
jgi:Tfp pilus assembly protein PilE